MALRMGIGLGLSRSAMLPALSLGFLGETLDPRITFSRGTTATRVNASGLIETVGTTTPRFDYDPVTLAPKGLLIEEARTNLLTYSEQFDNAAWADAAPTSTVTVAANNTTAPDGTSAADKLTAATGGTNAMARQAKTLLASTAYTGSIFVKASTSTQSRLLLRDTTAGTNFADATLTWTAGVPTVAGGSVGTWAIVPFGNGWYRVIGTGTSGATASPLVTFSIFPDTAAGTNAIFTYGAQLEAGSFATSYIPTVASQVTRSADVATMTGTNFSSWYNQSEGTFVAGFQTLQSGLMADTGFVLGLDNSTSKRILYIASGADVATTFDGTLALGAVGDVTGSVSKSGSAYTASERAIVSNGGAVSTGTVAAGYSTASSLNIGQRSSGNVLNGHIRQIAYYNTRLPNAQLQSLTA